jgi:hypothetical protein
METTMATTAAPAVLRFEKVTLYLQGEFFGNFHRVECKWVEVTRRPYAQYPDALWLRFVPKGKRNPRGTVLAYDPHAVILEGWATPEPDGVFGEKDADGSARSRHLSCSDG